MQVNYAKHLPKEKKIQLGGYYTPEKIVNVVYTYINSYLENKKLIIFDNAGGCGAFLTKFKNINYRIADCDIKAGNFLKEHFDSNNIFITNSLINVKREKYNIPFDSFLLMIGNPPYNDITSEFKNGEKGKNFCDDDIFDRDLGISFLKSYNKLNADVVCILHPLSYLIKETNFKRLKSFRENYRLIEATIFSSELFTGTGNQKFPIIVALYEKSKEGMDFEFIKNFNFNVLDNNFYFKLSNYKTTDGIISKYPPRKNDIQISPIEVYYYTFRDFNSLKKNASFMSKKHQNSIIVTIENIYQYSYLYCLKKLFKPENEWLYGNLSPLINLEIFEKNIMNYILYALYTNDVLLKLNESIKTKIINYYNILNYNTIKISKLEEIIKNNFNILVN